MQARVLLCGVLVVLLGGLSGCVIARGHLSQPLDEDSLATIQRGVTTKEEVLERFGPPYQVQSREVVAVRQITGVSIENGPLDTSRLIGSRHFRYSYTRANGFALITLLFNYFDADIKSDDLVIFFDENDVVEDYAFAKTTDCIAGYGFWSRLGGEPTCGD